MSTFAVVEPTAVTRPVIKLSDFTAGVKMTNSGQRALTPAEIARRRSALEQAEHSGEMEGLHITPAARADAEDYATGRIDIDQVVARTRSRYRLS